MFIKRSLLSPQRPNEALPPSNSLGHGLRVLFFVAKLASRLAFSLALSFGFFPHSSAVFAQGSGVFSVPDGSVPTAQKDSLFHIGAEEDVLKKNPQPTSAGSGSQYVVEDIQVEGNRLISTEEITSVVKTKKGDKFSREQVMEDLKAIDNMGYFDNQSLQVNPEIRNGNVLLKIRVQENAPVTQFAISGNDVIGTDEISKIFADQLGRPKNENAIATAIEKVEQAYHEKGFVLAKIAEFKDDPDGSVEVVINEGSIDNIEISGNKKTQSFIIKNAIRLKPGGKYNEAQLSADLRKLYGNGYFQDIRRSLVPSTVNPDKYTLKIEVDEKRTASLGLGGGVDSVAGPFGSFNISDNNFRGKGQAVSLSSQVGSGTFNSINNTLNNGGSSFLPTGRTYNVEASWIEPNLKGSDVSMAVTGFGRNMGSMFIDQAMQRTLGASVNFSKPLKHGWSANLGLTGENTTLKNMAGIAANDSILATMAKNAISTGMATDATQANSLANLYRDKQLKGGTFLSISPNLTRDTRDASADATRGSFLKASLTPTAGIGGAFLKAGVSASKYISPTKNFTIASNVQAGTAAGAMPQFAQFRLGGLNGIRGYRQFSDLGTGTGMLMATVEGRYRFGFLSDSNKVTKGIKDNIKLAVFADFGQALGNSSANSILGRSSMGAAVGIGLRVKMPMVGLVRLDYGFPLLNTALGGTTPRFTIGFGEKFY